MNVVIIGATFGIGYELGKKYLDQCDNLILLGRTQEKVQNLKLEFNSKRTKISTFSLDVTDKVNSQKIINEIIKETVADDCRITNVNKRSEWLVEQRIALVDNNDEVEILNRCVDCRSCSEHHSLLA